MTLLESLLHLDMIAALLLFVMLSVLVEVAGPWLLRSVAEVMVSYWLFEHVVIPIARAMTLVLFILVAYPALFGLEAAPPLGELLAADRLRLTTLLNLVFLLTLLLPLVPVIGRLQELVLPLQGITAATLLFRWLAAESPREIHYWPGLMTVLGLLLLASLTHWLAKGLAQQLAQGLDRTLGRAGSDKLIHRSVVMLMQMPVILLYTLSLGRQLQ
jgi:hypothetical protein